MAELNEIREAILALDQVNEIIVLHCVSEYPTGPLLEQRGLKALDERDAHLNMIELLKKEFPEHRIGYSDHTDGIFVPVIAAAMGAKVIEKHFTLDRKTPIENYMYGGNIYRTRSCTICGTRNIKRKWFLKFVGWSAAKEAESGVALWENRS